MALCIWAAGLGERTRNLLETLSDRASGSSLSERQLALLDQTLQTKPPAGLDTMISTMSPAIPAQRGCKSWGVFSRTVSEGLELFEKGFRVFRAF